MQPSECLPPIVPPKRRGGSTSKRRFKSATEGGSRRSRKKRHSLQVVKRDISLLPEANVIPTAEEIVDDAFSKFYKTLTSVTVSAVTELINLVSALSMVTDELVVDGNVTVDQKWRWYNP